MERQKDIMYKPGVRDLPIPEAMHTEYGFIIRWIFERFFSKIKFPDHEVEKIRSVQKSGTIIYAMLSRSFLSFLYLNFIFAKLELPLARFVNGVRLWLYQPLSRLLRISRVYIKGVTGRPSELKNRLNILTTAGESSLIFLRRPRSIIRPTVYYEIDFIETLIETQKETERPIYLLPIIIVFHKKPASERQGILDFIFGERDSPTLLREIFTMLFYHKYGEVRVGDAINLKEVLSDMASRSTDAISRHIRYLIYKNITKERTAITGPKKREPESIERLVLNDSIVVDTINRLAEGRRENIAQLNRRAEKIIRKMACNLDYNYIRFLDLILKAVWKITDIKLEYNIDGIARLKEALRRAPVVLCPMHRSHLDYLIISQILYLEDLVVPHIAAGDNLAFWPMGHIFRKSGAYFIRRTFKGDDLYISVFRAYMKRLLKDGWTQEFFIEGTRSRTGKLLQPKLGLLTYMVDAFLEGASEDIYFLPISILYEKVIEAGSYAKERLGREKSREDLKGLVRSTSVLTSKYGNIYVQFGYPISLKQFLNQRSLSTQKDHEDRKKSDILALGYTIAHEINRMATVSPSGIVSTVILQDSRRWFLLKEIERYTAFLLELVSQRGDVKIASSLNNIRDAIQETLKRFINDHSIVAKENLEGEILYRANENRRFMLDYYKNGFIHFLLNLSIASCSILTFNNYRCSKKDIFERSRRLREILKYEFIFKVNTDFESEFNEEFQRALAMKFIKKEGEEIELSKDYIDSARLLSSFLTSLLESYLIVSEYLMSVGDLNTEKRSFIKRLISFGMSMYDRAILNNMESISRVTFENAIEYLILCNILKKKEVERQSYIQFSDASDDSKNELRRLRDDILLYLRYHQ